MLIPNQMILFLIFIFQIILVNLIIRIILVFKEVFWGSITFIDIFKVLVNGQISDLFLISYLVPVFLGLVYFLPNNFYHKTLYKRFVISLIFIFFFILSWIGLSEIIFWNEFSSRFNFIAVDYLIYTKEVIGNIKESFSMSLFILLTSSVSLFLTFVFMKFFSSKISRNVETYNKIPWLLFLVFPILSFTISSPPRMQIKGFIQNELAKNGPYEFFSAYRHNQIDYDLYYKTIPKEKMNHVLARELQEDKFNLALNSLGQWVKVPTKRRTDDKYNVIFVAVESLSANFLESFGNKLSITPFLDSLKTDSLFFTNIFATGTRTVRGIEALTLGLPPSPGASIVRRPQNEDLQSLGKIFSSLQYDVNFIYGGHGIFDNMNYFFENNHFNIVDNSQFDDSEITFSNIWGACDEDLFNKVIKKADHSYRIGKKFFNFALTTSNHRPYTYPDGKIDIPSKAGREGGVKYTDFALRQLIQQSKNKPWFKDTIFVIVADHSAEGRGVLDIPVSTYHIPLIIYAPLLLKPQIIDRVASQIDIAPTLLSLVGIETDNLFIGKNILSMNKQDERFFSGTYQSVGYYKNGFFVQLGLKSKVDTYFYNPILKKLGDRTSNEEIEQEAISFYQYSNFLYKYGLYKLSPTRE